MSKFYKKQWMITIKTSEVHDHFAWWVLVFGDSQGWWGIDIHAALWSCVYLQRKISECTPQFCPNFVHNYQMLIWIKRNANN